MRCVWEHNGEDTLLYSVDAIGAYSRGDSLEAAVRKMKAEAEAYSSWRGQHPVQEIEIAIVQEKISDLRIADADSDVLFDAEKAPLTLAEYRELKALVLKSDSDFYDVQEDLYAYYKKKGILAEEITFPVKQSILMMFADFIHNGFTSKFKHIIVLSGIDEHTYVPKAAEIAQRMNIDMTLSGMFSKLIAGFNNQPKMSKSLPDSSIWVTMSQSEIEDMLLNHDKGYTDFNDSIVYQLMSSTFIYTDEELHEKAKHCIANSEEWIKDKIEFSKQLFNLCQIWQNA